MSTSRSHLRPLQLADLAALKLRHRRGHDLCRTFITLCREDGARADILEIVTHGAKSGDMISLYTSFPWKVLCTEVAKLAIARASVIEIPLAASASATSAATDTARKKSAAISVIPA